ncbi:MAG: radical SAM protein [Candidatus Shapirobacteria bacterium]|jgi:threonylcarbamoyladenosine tRNA methylthiotransferase MtaB
MKITDLKPIIARHSSHTFATINFGCRANASESNQLSQILVDLGLSPDTDKPDVYLVNTCAITKKGEYESIYQIKKIIKDDPEAIVLATGCAHLEKVDHIPRVYTFDNTQKETILKENFGKYSSDVLDKFSHTKRYVFRVQSGCSVNCTFCIVPSRRPYLNAIPLDEAVNTVNEAVKNGYSEVIITGVNLGQYFPGLSNLVEALLTRTKIELISFGSIPLITIDDKFTNLLSEYPTRVSRFLHIPLQSCSDKILKLMNRQYDKKRIIDTFARLKQNPTLTFGSDIIVGFPTETDLDFQETFKLCQSIGFSKLHVFRYSPRPDTVAREIFLKSEKISKDELTRRSRLIRSISGE